MSVMFPYRDELPRNMWPVVKGLEGKTVSTLEELQLLFPPDEKYGNVVEIKRHFASEFGDKKGYILYGRQKKMSTGIAPDELAQPVAYFCSACDTIIIGSLQKSSYHGISDDHPLSGTDGEIIGCKKCNTALESEVLRWS